MLNFRFDLNAEKCRAFLETFDKVPAGQKGTNPFSGREIIKTVFDHRDGRVRGARGTQYSHYTNLCRGVRDAILAQSEFSLGMYRLLSMLGEALSRADALDPNEVAKLAKDIEGLNEGATKQVPAVTIENSAKVVAALTDLEKRRESIDRSLVRLLMTESERRSGATVDWNLVATCDAKEAPEEFTAFVLNPPKPYSSAHVLCVPTIDAEALFEPRDRLQNNYEVVKVEDNWVLVGLKSDKYGDARMDSLDRLVRSGWKNVINLVRNLQKAVAAAAKSGMQTAASYPLTSLGVALLAASIMTGSIPHGMDMKLPVPIQSAASVKLKEKKATEKAAADPSGASATPLMDMIFGKVPAQQDASTMVDAFSTSVDRANDIDRLKSELDAVQAYRSDGFAKGLDEYDVALRKVHELAQTDPSLEGVVSNAAELRRSIEKHFQEDTRLTKDLQSLDGGVPIAMRKYTNPGLLDDTSFAKDFSESFAPLYDTLQSTRRQMASADPGSELELRLKQNEWLLKSQVDAMTKLAVVRQARHELSRSTSIPGALEDVRDALPTRAAAKTESALGGLVSSTEKLVGGVGWLIKQSARGPLYLGSSVANLMPGIWRVGNGIVAVHDPDRAPPPPPPLMPLPRTPAAAPASAAPISRMDALLSMMSSAQTAPASTTAVPLVGGIPIVDGALASKFGRGARAPQSRRLLENVAAFFPSDKRRRISVTKKDIGKLKLDRGILDKLKRELEKGGAPTVSPLKAKLKDMGLKLPFQNRRRAKTITLLSRS
tara:strand:- start:1669 stop:3987 length:2319 start_codon:yes stop_codon:yes gene_type:complete